MSASLAFVIPTRNRHQLAIAASRSLLARRDAPVSVVISDNSSSEAEARSLREHCEATDDERLLYVRPPGELDMGTHWDWALGVAMARTEATHIGVHYDRKLTKPGGTAELAEACDRHPGVIITYSMDFTAPAEDGFTVWQYPGTGREYEISTAQLVAATARGSYYDLGQAWPILSNCAVPRAVLERLRSRFGTICASLAPDSAFAFRACATEDRYVHHDWALSIVYSFRHSSGLSYFRRDAGGPIGDFRDLWAGRAWLDAAPIPGFDLGSNMGFNEYNLVRRAVGEERFPAIEWPGYLRELARGLAALEPAPRATAKVVLEQHGWCEEPTAPPPRPRGLRGRGLRRHLPRRWRPPPPPNTDLPLFATEEQAVAHLLEQTLPVAATNPLLDVLHPRELPSR